MPPLPIERVTVAPCFTFVGMDIAGPLYTKHKAGEEMKINKRYYLLYSCFTSRMIHVEVMLDRSTSEILTQLGNVRVDAASPSTYIVIKKKRSTEHRRN